MLKKYRKIGKIKLESAFDINKTNLITECFDKNNSLLKKMFFLILNQFSRQFFL